MISDRMTKDIDALIQKETDWAIEHLGHFNSRHEGWAVAKEELEEALNEVGDTRYHFGKLWQEIKEDQKELTCITYAAESTHRAIAELVQFAAMLEKMALYEQKDKEADE